MIDLSLKNVQKTHFVNKPLKHFKPKYKRLEVILDDVKNGRVIFVSDILNYNDLVKECGDIIVSSVHNYDDTKTTSIILSVELLKKNEDGN